MVSPHRLKSGAFSVGITFSLGYNLSFESMDFVVYRFGKFRLDAEVAPGNVETLTLA